MSLSFGALAVVLGSPAIAASLPADCPRETYLGNDPSDSDLPDWSDNAQGIANDGVHWFFTNKGGLFAYEADWSPVDGTDRGRIGHVGVPSELSGLGIDHFGDLDHFGGYLFVPFEGGGHALIAVFRASDLALVDWQEVTLLQAKAGWVALDPEAQILYTSEDHVDASTPLLRYDFDLVAVEDGAPGGFLAPLGPVPVQEADGSPLGGRLRYMQGGVFTPQGDLFVSVGTAEDSASDVRGGLHLLRRTDDGAAFRVVQSTVNASGHVGDGVFAYEYHPGSVLPGQEPEGIDWWARPSSSAFGGDLHAILLDNTLFDDPVWLKHYDVSYPCATTPITCEPSSCDDPATTPGPVVVALLWLGLLRRRPGGVGGPARPPGRRTA